MSDTGTGNAGGRRKALALLREKQCLELYLAGGMTLDEIAEQVGYATRTGAWKAIRRRLERDAAPVVEKAREREIGRLERVWAAAYGNLLAKKPGAVAECVRVSESFRRLLGTDAPTRIDATVTSEMERQIEELATRLGANDPGASPVAGVPADLP